MILLIRILEKVLIVYFSIYFIFDFFLFVSALFSFKKNKKASIHSQNDYRDHSISIIVPAYNEEVSILSCLHMLSELDYPDVEIIVVNDGSKDGTYKKVTKQFVFGNDLKDSIDEQLKTKKIKCAYKENTGKIIFIDKENGGKADAINAGINYSTKKYICTIDADSILDGQALKKVVKPLFKPETLVSGGQLAAANDIKIVHNRVVSAKMPRNIWVLWQVIEYIKSFMISRLSLSKINSLLVMSGAFSLYRREDLMKVGGFLTAHNNHPYIMETIGSGRQTVCEDMEIVVRLVRYYKEKKLKGKAVFIPQPVCWTEVPDNPLNLYKQRVRWHLGLAETLRIHGDMMFEPKYGVVGLIALPYYLLFELFSPVLKIVALLFVIVASIFHLINTGWVTLLLISILLTTAIITSTITVFIENWSEKQATSNRDALRYKTFSDWLWILSLAIVGDFSFAFFRTYAQFMGLINFVRKKSEWNKFERRGIQMADHVKP
jgi:cellulose synthase/poly-beta-1,6-N-acetylglucosamine synthase-like glycosyltransferase